MCLYEQFTTNSQDMAGLKKTKPNFPVPDASLETHARFFLSSPLRNNTRVTSTQLDFFPGKSARLHIALCHHMASTFHTMLCREAG